MKKLIYQGSVKNLFEVSENEIEFEFTDNYSIYDWGIMPDSINGKGNCLANMANTFFTELSKPELKINMPPFYSHDHFDQLLASETFKDITLNGVKNHFIEQVSSQSIKVKKVDILHPVKNEADFEYKAYNNKPENTLIPLEVVFRFGAPLGSSYLKRHPEIEVNSFFKTAVIEFYTKLEPFDRKLSNEEAKKIAALSSKEFNEIIERTEILALYLQNRFMDMNLDLWDGKFEFAFGESVEGNREIILVDSIGPDELRLTHNSFPFSKEFLRQHYQDTQWLKHFKETQSRDIVPKKLPLIIKRKAEQIYSYLNNCLQEKQTDFPEIIKDEIYPYNVIIFGQGGREHALADHLSKSNEVKHVYVIPGNPGINGHKYSSHIVDPVEYIPYCKHHQIKYAVIGPEVLLEDGLTDKLEENGILTASPSKKASLLESSKAYAKDFMAKYNIPTADYKNFTSTTDALNYVKEHDSNRFVVKLSALAAGKGVILCQNKEDTYTAIKTLAPNNEEIVIEEFLTGKELSFFALCLNDEFLSIGTACDYKRLKNNDEGPNTGGMGCYSPTYWLNAVDKKYIEESIITPTLKGMLQENRSFKGTLFVGIMMTDKGPKVLEYNVRFGDPETQTLLPRLSQNLSTVFMAMATNNIGLFKRLENAESEKFSVHIVKAAKGYPGTNGDVVEKGQAILVDETKLSNFAKIYFAGVNKKDTSFITNGGRVLGVTTLGENLEDTRAQAYQNIKACTFEGEQYREDIAK